MAKVGRNSTTEGVGSAAGKINDQFVPRRSNQRYTDLVILAGEHIMRETIKAISQRAAREGLGTPELFNGGVYVTKNGTPELFITTAADRAQELAEQQQEREQKALVKLVALATQDITKGNTYTVDEALARLRAART